MNAGAVYLRNIRSWPSTPVFRSLSLSGSRLVVRSCRRLLQRPFPDPRQVQVQDSPSINQRRHNKTVLNVHMNAPRQKGSNHQKLLWRKVAHFFPKMIESSCCFGPKFLGFVSDPKETCVLSLLKSIQVKQKLRSSFENRCFPNLR